MLELIISFLVLCFLEIVLGVDNLVFIAIVANKVRAEIRHRVRIFGLLLSLVLRLVMLFFIALLLALKATVFSIYTLDFSIKDLIMIAGGLFLIIKGGMEIYEQVFVSDKHALKEGGSLVLSAPMAIVQIVIIDFVFSLDSLITAIGLTTHYLTIAAAISVSIIFMIIFAPKVGYFIETYPSLKLLAVMLIFLIGFVLVFDGFAIHIDKSYIYFAIGFSLVVEVLNIIMKRNKSK
ncbi:MAG: TerC family protein [Alphaproteobacteria bacterium]|jgi:predicted tellurium resistance membrane protein TerC|nr:TerC family protein [Alphaproteobacteria bacterium]